MRDLRALVLEGQAGDMSAFEEIVKRFQNMAFGYAYAHLGDFHQAQDVAQEAFMDAYRLLPQLRSPEAFAGWFRRIVFKHCDRFRRRRLARLVSLDAAVDLPVDGAGPTQILERRETCRDVQAAIQSLSERLRLVTTLFYLHSYSQKEIAAFLEVPLTTIKKRLCDARAKLKERMIEMISETMKQNMPDELFSKKVVQELMGRPRPLQIPGHPVREVWEQIQAALSDYEVVEGQEVVNTRFHPAVQQDMDVSRGAYRVDDESILRTHMTHTTFQALEGRPLPVRLLAAGRCFRPDREDRKHAKVFHQVDGLCVAQNGDVQSLQATCQRALEGVFGSIELRWREGDFGFVDCGMQLDLKSGSEWVGIGGSGLLKPEMLLEAGYDAGAHGFSFGIGLERLAMMKLSLDDIQQVWRAPYV